MLAHVQKTSKSSRTSVSGPPQDSSLSSLSLNFEHWKVNSREVVNTINSDKQSSSTLRAPNEQSRERLKTTCSRDYLDPDRAKRKKNPQQLIPCNSEEHKTAMTSSHMIHPLKLPSAIHGRMTTLSSKTLSFCLFAAAYIKGNGMNCRASKQIIESYVNYSESFMDGRWILFMKM